MKKLIFGLLIALTQTSTAGLPGSPVLEGEPGFIGRGRPMPPPVQEVEIEGLASVKAENKFTVTCMAIGCPPSELYHEVKLVLQNPSVFIENNELLVQSGLGAAPQNISLANTTVRDGDLVSVRALVRVFPRGRAELIELIEVRHAGQN